VYVSGQPTVLHVDGDPTALELSSDRAGDTPVTWVTASDPEAGLAALADHDVDCLVSDVFGTDDGVPFVVRATDHDPALSVVLFTAADRGSVAPAARRVATEYVPKRTGNEFDVLFERLATHIPTLPGGGGDGDGDGDDDGGGEDTPSERGVAVAPRPERRVTGRDRSTVWVPIDRHNWTDEGADLATTIVTAVERHTGEDVSATPLYESVDAEMLEALLSRPDGGSRNGIQVRFLFADRELAVTSEGLVLLRSETELE
jgi:CheY-like chemotaxis protein